MDALLARSQCYMDNGQLDLSLKDADAAMKGYKRVSICILNRHISRLGVLDKERGKIERTENVMGNLSKIRE